MKRLVIFIAILTVIIFMAGIVPVFAEETNRTVIKHDNSAITYTGNWFTNAQTGDCKRSTTAGEKAELQFTGTGFEIYVNNGTGAGLMKVYVDGQLVATVDTYSPNINLGIKIYEKTDLTPGTHTLLIENGGKGPNSTASNVNLHSIVVINESASTEEPKPTGGDDEPTPVTSDPMPVMALALSIVSLLSGLKLRKK